MVWLFAVCQCERSRLCTRTITLMKAAATVWKTVWRRHQCTPVCRFPSYVLPLKSVLLGTFLSFFKRVFFFFFFR